MLALLAVAAPDIETLLATDVTKTASLSEREAICLVLKNLHMSCISGARDFADLQTLFPNAHLAVLSCSVKKRDVDAAIALGLAGFLPKTMSASAFVNALRLIMSGERYFPIGAVTNQADMAARLTERELDVLRHLRRGASNKEIARSLAIELSNVKALVRSIMLKFGAANRTEIAIRAIEKGL